MDPVVAVVTVAMMETPVDSGGTPTMIQRDMPTRRRR